MLNDSLSTLQIIAIIFCSVFFLIDYSFSKKKELVYLFSLMPSTILHELSHLIFALLLNGKPNKISIVPKKDKNYWQLGYVEFTPTWYNAAFIAFAPVSLLVLAVYLYLQNNVLIVSPILYWLIRGGIPSITDVKVGISHGFVIILLILYITFWVIE